MKSKAECQNCELRYNIRGLRFFKGKFLCWKCFRKFITKMPETLYDDPLSKKIQMNVQLTPGQEEKFRKRIKTLYGEGRVVGKYIRSLIIADMDGIK